MNKIRETFLKKYGIPEYVLFVLGVALLSYQTFKYFKDDLEGDMVDIAVFVIGFLFLVAPMTLVNLIKKARGIDGR